MTATRIVIGDCTPFDHAFLPRCLIDITRYPRHLAAWFRRLDKHRLTHGFVSLDPVRNVKGDASTDAIEGMLK